MFEKKSQSSPQRKLVVKISEEEKFFRFCGQQACFLSMQFLRVNRERRIKFDSTIKITKANYRALLIPCLK